MIKKNIKILKSLQSELDECNENCDIITQNSFGRSDTIEEKEAYATNMLRAEALRKEIKRVIEQA